MTNIGELLGTITLEDRFSTAFELAANRTESVISRMENGFGAAALAVGAVTTAIAGMAGTIVALGVAGSKLNDIDKGFNRVAGSAENATRIFEAMNTALKGAVDDDFLKQFASQSMSTGAIKTAEAFETVSKAARSLAREGFGSVEQMMGQIQSAMTTGRVRSLQYLTGVIDLKGAEEKYAKSLGVTRDQLSTQGRLHADQIAILEKLQERVRSVGDIQTTFAEKISAANIALENWYEGIQTAVAASPSVNRALDAIGDALVRNFGGDAQNLQETIIRWINRFADAAAYYGPIVIDWIAKVWKGVQDIKDRVIAAWNLVPDWFKNIARDAALAGGAIYVMGKAVDAIGGGSGGGMLGDAASVATIFSGASQAFRDLANVVPKAVKEIKAFAVEFALVKALSGGGIAGTIRAIAASFEALYASSMLFRGGVWAAVAYGVYKLGEAFYKLYQTWKATGDLWNYFRQGGGFWDNSIIGRMLGMSRSVEQTADAMSRLVQQRKELESLMGSRTGSGPSASSPNSPVEPPLNPIEDMSSKIKAATKESIQQTTALWEQYYDTLDRRSVDHYDVETRRAQRWFDQQKKLLDESKAFNTNYWNQLDALVSVYYAKLEDAAAQEALRKIKEQTDAMAESIIDSLPVLDKLEVPEKNRRSFRELTTVAMRAEKAINDLFVKGVMAAMPLDEKTKQYIKRLDELGMTAEEIADKLGIALQQVEKTLGTNIRKIDAAMRDWGNVLTQLAQISGDAFGGFMQDLAEIVNSYNQAAQAAEHFAEAQGKAGKALAVAEGVMAVANATSSGSTGKRMVGGGVAGARAGAMFGPWGTVLGGGLGMLTGWLRGRGQEERRVNDMRDDFQSQFGRGEEGFRKMSEAAFKATGNLKLVQDLLNAKTVEDYTRAQEALTEAINKQAEAVATINEMGFQTQDQLNAQVTRFQAAYDEMVRQGTFTAEELFKAWQKVEEAQRRAARDPNQELADMAEAAGYRTREQLQEAADKAQRLAEYMRDSGRFTAESVEDAFKKAQEAADRALGINTEAMRKLQAEFDSLQQSVNQEALEDEMGSTERKMRERMEQIKKEMEAEQARIGAARAAADEQNARAAGTAIARSLVEGLSSAEGLTENLDRQFTKSATELKETFDLAALDAADAIQRRFDIEIRIPIHFDPDAVSLPSGTEPRPMVAGGIGYAASPMTFSTQGNEWYAFSGEGRGLDQILQPGGGQDISVLRSDIAHSLPLALKKALREALQEARAAN